ncbi:hypothetical protein BDB13_3518 [Rhodococcus sp. OK302]|nr:hypothetical protein BDB13_3518 [Rhodococcus sp. OK302]
MLVVVLTVCSVSMTIVDVVRVIAVRDGDVAAPFTMDVVVTLVHVVLARLTFVDMVAVGAVKVPVMHVVDVVTMRNGNVAAPFSMNVFVFGVLVMLCCHRTLLRSLSDC